LILLTALKFVSSTIGLVAGEGVAQLRETIPDFLLPFRSRCMQQSCKVRELVDQAGVCASSVASQRARDVWNCPDLTHTKFSWQACQQEVCGGEETTPL